ncbi:MAG: EAL domain-containing protein, partial [Rubrivivax sp.]|nr:EAL domain-containing protein [Rubrivivax sp.]
WPLFLKATFGSVDWRFSVPMPAAPTLGDASVGDWALQVGLATVLLISLLGLVLVRRTMVPLERLTTATGALAAGRWDTRVVLPADDEFGQLAQSLNAMAGRIDDQMQTLAAHAAIDRAILDGVDVAGVIRRVADRLRALAPGAHTAVLLCGEGPADWVVHARGGPAQPLAVASDFDPGGVDDLGLRAPSTAQMPPWVRDALKLPASAAMACCWAQAPGQGKPAALLLMAGPPPWQPDADQRLALLDLRDRVAVTLDAAARERRLLDRALRDGLTGLLNRHGLQDEAETLLAGSDAARPSAMMFVDLDGFKQVNDAMGHHMGDELLRAVAGRLRQAVPAEALLARPGGDEFVIVLPGPAADAERMAAALCKVLSDRFQLADQPVHVGASIGISLYPDDGLTLSDLMRRADLAMYAAKTGGRGAWRRFTPALEDRVTERAWMVRDLRQALVQDGLLLHYQPRVDARSGELSSVEALVRWPHPQRGMVPPDRFIPVAEDSGLIERLGVFVLETALAQLKRWRADGVRVPCVAVNVSARQLLDDSFTGTVLARLARHGLAPSDLELEITESLFVGDSGRVSALLEPLRAAGVSMAMDDFGTGYSSLAALHSLPFDVLKIDRSFVAALDGPRSSDAVVRSVLLLARELGKHVVAEGVETDTQRTRLLALGCDQFQG